MMPFRLPGTLPSEHLAVRMPLDPTKRYLITGGSGFLGRALIRRLVQSNVQHLTVLARGAAPLTELIDAYPLLRVIVGDVADACAVERAMRGVSGVFHLAAFKHVGLAEQHVKMCVETNVLGTMTMLNAVQEMRAKPEFFAYISTDKAARVTGVYGATKLLGERLVAETAAVNPAMRCLSFRYGNVWGSTGSVLHRWRRQMEVGGTIRVTDLEATRFFFTADDAVSLILDHLGDASGLVIPTMKAASVRTVLNAMHRVYGRSGVFFDLQTIGLQPGENLHETLNEIVFSDQVPQYTVDEFIETFLGPSR